MDKTLTLLIKRRFLKVILFSILIVLNNCKRDQVPSNTNCYNVDELFAILSSEVDYCKIYPETSYHFNEMNENIQSYRKIAISLVKDNVLLNCFNEGIFIEYSFVNEIEIDSSLMIPMSYTSLLYLKRNNVYYLVMFYFDGDSHVVKRIRLQKKSRKFIDNWISEEKLFHRFEYSASLVGPYFQGYLIISKLTKEENESRIILNPLWNSMYKFKEYNTNSEIREIYELRKDLVMIFLSTGEGCPF